MHMKVQESSLSFYVFIGKKTTISEYLLSFDWTLVMCTDHNNQETSQHNMCSRLYFYRSNPLPALTSTPVPKKCNGFTYLGASSNTLFLPLLPYRPYPEHVIVLNLLFHLGHEHSMLHYYTSCWPWLLSGAVSPARMLSPYVPSVHVNKHMQPNCSASRGKWQTLSLWHKWPHCQKSEESFAGYSSLQIHCWSNFNSQIKMLRVIYWLFSFSDWPLESKNAALGGLTQGLEELGCIFFHLKLEEVNSWWKWGGDWWLWKLQGLLPTWDSFGTASQLWVWPCPLWLDSNLSSDLGKTTLLLAEAQIREWGKKLSRDQVKIILFHRRGHSVRHVEAGCPSHALTLTHYLQTWSETDWLITVVLRAPSRRLCWEPLFSAPWMSWEQSDNIPDGMLSP